MAVAVQIAHAPFIYLRPPLSRCLIFDQTKPLFQKWLMYGIGTVFSLAMLSFISTIVLNVTARAAAALWSSNFINSLIGSSSEGLSTQALEQGGIGLLMTMLVISVPPMAGNFFSATLGSFSAYNVFNNTAGGLPGPGGQPPGSYGYGGHGPLQAGIGQANSGQLSGGGGFSTPSGNASSSGARLSGSGHIPVADVTKQGGGLANPPASR